MTRDQKLQRAAWRWELRYLVQFGVTMKLSAGQERRIVWLRNKLRRTR